MFILSLMVATVLKHQLFLLKSQELIEARALEARQERNQRLIESVRHCEGTPEAIQIVAGLLREYPRNDEDREYPGNDA